MNRHRYLDWLGEELGYRSPQDWQQLRPALLRQYRGKGLLRHYDWRVAPLLAEYLMQRGQHAA